MENNEIITAQGEKEQEVAEPAKTDAENIARDENEKILNARFAAVRRKAEKQRDMAIEAKTAEFNAEKEAAIKEAIEQYKASLGNTTDIRNVKDEESGVEKSEVLKDDGTKPVSSVTDAAIIDEVMQIGEYDPDIRSVSDLPKMKNFERFCDLVRRGNTFLDAYRIANFDLIAQTMIERNERTVLNRFAGKMHMHRSTSHGDAVRTVPRDVLEKYRSFLPGCSYSEIQKHYTDYYHEN